MRKFLLNVHLYVAAFVAPVFILLGLSGGLYLLDIKGEVTRTEIALPADASLDFESDNLEAEITALLASQGISHKFESLSRRGGPAAGRGPGAGARPGAGPARGGGFVQTRPSSRTSYHFRRQGGQLTVTRVTPDFQKVMIELHKGHGPSLFRTYQKLVALALILAVLSGVWMGLASKVLRKQTALAATAGLIAFIGVAFLA